MAWLFERTIEFAAWVAMIAAWIMAVIMVRYLLLWFGTLQTEPDWDHLCTAGKAAGACIGAAVSLGVLACVDRFIYDVGE